MGTRWSALTFFTLAAVLGAAPAVAEEWSRARIERLPDSAFAVVEWVADGELPGQLRNPPGKFSCIADDDGS